MAVCAHYLGSNSNRETMIKREKETKKIENMHSD